MSSSNLTKSQIREWWSKRRIKYNYGLIVSGIVSFLLFSMLADLLIPEKYYEVNLFTMFFQGLWHLGFILIANVFYSLGFYIDKSFNKNNRKEFRINLFNIWFGLSVFIPFIIPILIVIQFLFNNY